MEHKTREPWWPTQTYQRWTVTIFGAFAAFFLVGVFFTTVAIFLFLLGLIPKPYLELPVDVPVRSITQVLGAVAGGIFVWRRTAPNKRSLARWPLFKRLLAVAIGFYATTGGVVDFVSSVVGWYVLGGVGGLWTVSDPLMYDFGNALRGIIAKSQVVGAALGIVSSIAIWRWTRRGTIRYSPSIWFWWR